MDCAQVVAHHPGRRVEPLQRGEQVRQQHVHRMSEPYVGLLMNHYRLRVGAVVLAGEDNELHPAHGRDGLIHEHDDGAVGLPELLSARYKTHEGDYGCYARKQHGCGTDYVDRKKQTNPVETRTVRGRLRRSGRENCCSQGSGLDMEGDHARRKNSGNDNRKQHGNSVEGVQRLPGQEYPEEYVEQQERRCKLELVDQKGHGGTGLSSRSGTVLNLVDKLAELVESNLLFTHQRGDSAEIGIPETGRNHAAKAAPAVLLPGNQRIILITRTEGLMGKIAVRLKDSDHGRESVDMGARFRIELAELAHEHRAVLPEEIHYLRLFLSKLLHLDKSCLEAKITKIPFNATKFISLSTNFYS